MSNYKDTFELYKDVIDEVHAPDELKKRIKSMDTKHIKFNKIKLIPATAACLAVALIITVIVGSFNGKGNSFVLKASASEIGGDSFVKIAAAAPVGIESRSVVEEDKKTQIVNCIIPFAIKCDGRNIKSIKYTVDNAVFLFPYDSYASEYREKYPEQASSSDKITEKIKSNNIIESNIEKDNQYSSYTVSFNDQIDTEFNDYADMQTFPICILARISSEDNISQETKDAFEHLKSEGSLSDESYLNEIFDDIRVVYDEMFGKVTVTAEIKYDDGTTDSASLQFSCISADQKNGFLIGTKTI